MTEATMVESTAAQERRRVETLHDRAAFAFNEARTALEELRARLSVEQASKQAIEARRNETAAQMVDASPEEMKAALVELRSDLDTSQARIDGIQLLIARQEQVVADCQESLTPLQAELARAARAELIEQETREVDALIEACQAAEAKWNEASNALVSALGALDRNCAHPPNTSRLKDCAFRTAAHIRGRAY